MQNAGADREAKEKACLIYSCGMGRRNCCQKTAHACAGPVRRDGVSRLSAYHHYGMVSPFKVARDALLAGSNGAQKYVDEFFTWREVAHAFCFRSWPELESVQVW